MIVLDDGADGTSACGCVAAVSLSSLTSSVDVDNSSVNNKSGGNVDDALLLVLLMLCIDDDCENVDLGCEGFQRQFSPEVRVHQKEFFFGLREVITDVAKNPTVKLNILDVRIVRQNFFSRKADGVESASFEGVTIGIVMSRRNLR
jgi:hypothetical protein